MVFKAYAKVNIFLKFINRLPSGYHTLISRFVKVPYLYDTITFIEHRKKLSHFTINGNFDFPTTQNSIYKSI